MAATHNTDVETRDAKGMKADAKAKRSRAWVFTLNNYTPEDEIVLKKLECEYMIYGHEHTGPRPSSLKEGDPWTPHLQGYVYFANARTMSAIKKKTTVRIHLEPAVGKAEDSRRYCTKEDTEGFYEMGTMPEQGKRNDMALVKDIVMEGGTMDDVVRVASNYQVGRWGEWLMKYQPVPPLDRELDVYWYWGATGTGKTWAALHEAEAEEGGYWMSSKNLRWWDGYQGQKNIVIDDFRADFCPLHELLRYLDPYPCRVEVKGSSFWFAPRRIWITCPYPPHDAYQSERAQENIGQLTGRITAVKQFAGENRRLAKQRTPDDPALAGIMKYLTEDVTKVLTK
jgi:hypothetical protein